MNGKQPRYGPAPVMSNETTSVVPLKGKQTHIRRCQFSHRLDVRADVVLFLNKACQRPERQYRSHVWVCPSEDIYTHQIDVFHDIQPNADQGHPQHHAFQKGLSYNKSGGRFWKMIESRGCFRCRSLCIRCEHA